MSGLPLFAIAALFAAATLLAVLLWQVFAHYLAVHRQRFSSEMDTQLREAFVFIESGQLYRLLLIGAIGMAVLAYFLTDSLGWGLALLALSGLAPKVALGWLKARRIKRFSHQLPDALSMISGGLRSGSSLTQAIAMAARECPVPISQELSLVMREQRLGASLDACMTNLETRIHLAEVTLFAAAVRVAQETGGNLAETLDRLVDTLRRKMAVEGKIDSLTAQGRLQGWVMAFLPVGIAAALFMIEPQAMQPLLTTWYGALVCVVVVVLEVLGLYFIRKIVRIDV